MQQIVGQYLSSAHELHPDAALTCSFALRLREGIFKFLLGDHVVVQAKLRPNFHPSLPTPIAILIWPHDHDNFKRRNAIDSRHQSMANEQNDSIARNFWARKRLNFPNMCLIHLADEKGVGLVRNNDASVASVNQAIGIKNDH